MTSMDLSTLRTLFAVIGFLSFLFWAFNRRHPVRESLSDEQSNSVEYIYFGASLISDGYDFFPDWSTSMLREFDNRIEPELEQLYQLSRTVAEQPRETWLTVIQNELSSR